MDLAWHTTPVSECLSHSGAEEGELTQRLHLLAQEPALTRGLLSTGGSYHQASQDLLQKLTRV